MSALIIKALLRLKASRHVKPLTSIGLRKSVSFGNAYPEALPTIPIRTQLNDGTADASIPSVATVNPEDLAIAQILSQEGYVSGLFQIPITTAHRE